MQSKNTDLNAAPGSLDLDVHEQIECAHTLASKFYADPHILEVEQARIFRRTWQLVGTVLRRNSGKAGAQPVINGVRVFELRYLDATGAPTSDITDVRTVAAARIFASGSPQQVCTRVFWAHVFKYGG